MTAITFTAVHTFHTRRADLPLDMIVFNAPRPIYGEAWNGEFIEGRFYAAIDPADTLSARYAEENRRLHAVVVEYVTQEEARTQVEAYYAENDYPTEGLTDLEVRQAFLANNPEQSRTIEFAGTAID